MVGTSAVGAFLARKLSTARRSAGTVRTIKGLRDIWTRSLETGKAASADGPAGSRPYQARWSNAKRVIGGRLPLKARQQPGTHASNGTRSGCELIRFMTERTVSDLS
jgi:hypothetical protein